LTREDPVSIEDPPFRNKIYKNKLETLHLETKYIKINKKKMLKQVLEHRDND
jgi:hypothetical protein